MTATKNSTLQGERIHREFPGGFKGRFLQGRKNQIEVPRKHTVFELGNALRGKEKLEVSEKELTKTVPFRIPKAKFWSIPDFRKARM